MSKVPTILDGTFFEVVSCDGNKVTAICKTCSSSKAYSGLLSSTSNFLLHLKRVHPAMLTQFEVHKRQVAQGRRHSIAIFKQMPREKKPALQQTIPEMNSTACVKIDNLIINYIVEEMLPLSTINNPAFRELITTLYPSANIMSQKTLVGRLNDKYTKMKRNIANELMDISYVCTTADIWSNNKYCYFGVTAHWITSELQRKSCILACRRFTGHSYGQVDKMLQDTFTECNLEQGQITATVTGNFLTSNKPGSYEKNNSKDVEDSEMEDDDDDDDDIKVADIMPLLSTHHKCVVHTLDFVMNYSTEYALKENISYRELHNSCMVKCNALWNVSSRPKAAEKIHYMCGKKLLRPSSTKWNSTFESLQRLLEAKDMLPQLCSQFNVEAFEEMEIAFLTEYISVMHPVTTALDMLQSEEKGFLAYFLPSLFRIEKILTDILPKLALAQPLAEAVLKCLNLHFRDALQMTPEANCYILASVTHPFFKVRWVPETQKPRVLELLINSYPAFTSKPYVSLTPEVKQENEFDNFFEFESENSPIDSVAHVQIFHYLEDVSKDLDSLMMFPIVKDMFIRYNTIIPSSVPVERLFSISGGRIFTSHYNELSNNTFQKLLLLKQNKDFSFM